MALTMEFIDDGRGVLHVGSGVVSGAELIAAAGRDLAAAREGLPLAYGLVDLTDTTRFDALAGDIREVARINLALAGIIGRACVAVVAPQDVAFGMSRMWEAYMHAAAWETCVFRQRAEADAWLAAHTGG